MHKLVKRQLKRYLAIETEEAIPENLVPFITAVSDAYSEADEDLRMMEWSLELSSMELTEQNEKISNTLRELQETQTQLVHSAKMAGLGELVAGVSHEINTPAGAILNAIQEVKASYINLLPLLVKVVRNLERELHEDYYEACLAAVKYRNSLSTSEARQIAKEIEELLLDSPIIDKRRISKNLTFVGFKKENIHLLQNIFKSQAAEMVCQTLFEMGMTQAHVSNIEIAIGRVIHLVKALRLYSHSEAETMSPSDIREDITTTLTILNNKLKHGIEVKKEFDEIPKINCFSDQLNQVWTNLINNAIDAIPEEGRIIIRTKKISNFRVAVEVEDNGSGIEISVQDKIFNPYVTTKPKGIGTGLGLSISKEIILKHKGSISFESQPGKTVFTVTLPIDVNQIGINA